MFPPPVQRKDGAYSAMKRKKNKKRMFSLSYKVFLTAVAIAILPMLIVGTMLFTQSANIVKKNESAAKLNTLAHIGTNVCG